MFKQSSHHLCIILETLLKPYDFRKEFQCTVACIPVLFQCIMTEFFICGRITPYVTYVPSKGQYVPPSGAFAGGAFSLGRAAADRRMGMILTCQ